MIQNLNAFGFISAGAATGGGGNKVVANDIATGALVADTEKSVAHGLTGCTKFAFMVRDADNYVDVDEIKIDPANPTTKFLIRISVNLAGGLTVQCFGY